MPRRAVECNRASVEAALMPGQRATLASLCSTLSVSPTGWHKLPAFRCFILAGMHNLASELRASGQTHEATMMTAAVRLGISENSYKSWLQRGRRESRVQPAPSPRVASAA